MTLNLAERLWWLSHCKYWSVCVGFKIIEREGHHMSRYIKEFIFIRVNNPTLNNNIGKFNLPHIWDRVLINTPGLKLNK